MIRSKAALLVVGYLVTTAKGCLDVTLKLYCPAIATYCTWDLITFVDNGVTTCAGVTQNTFDTLTGISNCIDGYGLSVIFDSGSFTWTYQTPHGTFIQKTTAAYESSGCSNYGLGCLESSTWYVDSEGYFGC